MNFWERNNFNSQNGMNGNTYNNTYNNDNGNGRCGAENIEADVRNKFEQYSGKSEDQLMNELAATVARMKNDGTFDATAMENLYNTASPFLNDMQRQRMRAIIDMFKG